MDRCHRRVRSSTTSKVYADIEADHRTFRIRGGDCDQWSMYPVISEIGGDSAPKSNGPRPYASTYERMTPGLDRTHGPRTPGTLPPPRQPSRGLLLRLRRSPPRPLRPRTRPPDKPQRGATGKALIAAFPPPRWPSPRGKTGGCRPRAGRPTKTTAGPDGGVIDEAPPISSGAETGHPAARNENSGRVRGSQAARTASR